MLAIPAKVVRKKGEGGKEGVILYRLAPTSDADVLAESQPCKRSSRNRVRGRSSSSASAGATDTRAAMMPGRTKTQPARLPTADAGLCTHPNVLPAIGFCGQVWRVRGSLFTRLGLPRQYPRESMFHGSRINRIQPTQSRKLGTPGGRDESETFWAFQDRN